MKSNAKDDKNEFQNSGEFGESSEDTSGFFESSSTLNNESSYKSSTPEQFVANANVRLRSRKMQQQQVRTFYLLSHSQHSFFATFAPHKLALSCIISTEFIFIAIDNLIHICT
jgi:hypothetical protein